MTFYTPDFFFEHLVPKTGFKFSLAQGRGRDLHGLLPSTQEHLTFLINMPH